MRSSFQASAGELPQLWNVVRGQMTVVGPRPILPEQLRWDQAFVRRDSARLRLWIILRTFMVLAPPETVYGEPGKNWRAYLPEGARPEDAADAS